MNDFEVDPMRVVPYGLGTSFVTVSDKYEDVWTALSTSAVVLPYRGLRVAFFGRSGTGKSEIAARLHRLLLRSHSVLAPINAPWVSATWLGEHLRMDYRDTITGETLRRVYGRSYYLTLDGLGEEDPKMRGALDALLKLRFDNGRGVCVTSRLPLDGTESLAAWYPCLRAQLSKFYYAVKH